MTTGPQQALSVPAAADGTGAVSHQRREQASRLARRWLPRLAFLAAGVPLFVVYLRLSDTVPVNSDGATNALQAWDMLHGNLLLHGWSLSDVSFYTTDLPQYMIVEALRGLGPYVVHVVAAATYTVIVALCVALARGQSTGAQAAVRMLITAGILLAPQPPQYSGGAAVLLSSPDHVATAAPVLAAWLILDRAGRQWRGPVLAALLLGWALAGDSVALYTGVAPLLITGIVHAYRKVHVRRQPLRSACWELSLVAAGAAAVLIAWLAAALIRWQQGFVVWPPLSVVVNARGLPHRFWITVQGVLVLFGADNYGWRPGGATVVGLVHLAGFCLAVAAVAVVVRRLRRDTDLTAQLLVVGIVANIAAYLAAVSLSGAREMAAVLPFGAVLAGRALGGWVIRARLVPALAALLAGFLVALGHSVGEPARPAQNQGLPAFLAAHHLRYGLAGYWQASATTLDTGNRVQVRPVSVADRTSIIPHQWLGKPWEIQRSWYNPRSHDATFLVVSVERHAAGGAPGVLPAWPAVLHAFGRPAKIYRVGRFEVLVWHHNLLDRLGLPPRAG